MRGQSDIEVDIRALAERQYGVVARHQLRALGLGDDAVDHRRRNGRLVRAAPAVYALGHQPTGERARWMTATLACGPTALLVDRSAAALWDLGIDDHGATSVAVSVTAGVRGAGGFAPRRLGLRDDERTMRWGLPVTTVSRTLVDLGACCTAGELRRAVERADALELFDLRAVQPIIDRRRGRPGVSALTHLLADAKAHGLPRTRSLLEAEFLEFCLAQRLPRPQVNRWDGARECDFRWPARRLVVESDGWQYHRTRAAFERDAARSQALAAEGWTLVRLTWRQLKEEPAAVAARLGAILST